MYLSIPQGIIKKHKTPFRELVWRNKQSNLLFRIVLLLGGLFVVWTVVISHRKDNVISIPVLATHVAITQRKTSCKFFHLLFLIYSDPSYDGVGRLWPTSLVKTTLLISKYIPSDTKCIVLTRLFHGWNWLENKKHQQNFAQRWISVLDWFLNLPLIPVIARTW